MSVQPQVIPSVQDFLAGGAGGSETVKFPNVNDAYQGTVTAERLEQSRMYKQDGIGELEFWDDGKPKLQLVLTLTTEGSGEERRMFMKSLLLKAAKEALASAGQTSFVGGSLSVVHTGVAKNRAKEYRVVFKAGIPEVATGWEPATEPTTEAVVGEVPEGLSPEAVEALKAAGLTG